MPTNIEGNLDIMSRFRGGLVEQNGDLAVDVKSFFYDVGGTKGQYAGASNQAVTDDDTNYVYLDSSYNLQINTTGYPGTAHIRLAKVFAANGTITSINDERAFLSVSDAALAHSHSNKAQLDLVTDGDHDARTDNPHGVTAAQAGAAPSSEGVTNGDSHDHSGGDGAQIDHTTLSNIGSNSHATIDTHLAASAPHSGHATTDHDATHISAGSDEIDGDKLDIDWNPTNYTPSITPTEADSVDNLTAHLYGIDQAIGSISGGGGQTDTVTGSNGITNTGDNVDAVLAPTYGSSANTICQGNDSRLVTNGDSHDHSGGDGAQIDHTTLSNIGSNSHSTIDTHIASSSNPHSVTAAQAGAAPSSEGVTNGNSHDHNGGDGAQIDHTTLSNIGSNAHSAIDTHLAASAPHSGHAAVDHDALHIKDGSDEIDGDKLDIDWNPTNYTPATTPTEVDNVDHLTAHLYGIDQALASAGGTSLDRAVDMADFIGLKEENWEGGQVGTGTYQVIDGLGGQYELDTGASNNSAASIQQKKNVVTIASNFNFKCRFKLLNTSQTYAEIGLTNWSGSYIIFAKGSSYWRAKNSNGTETNTDDVADLDTNWHIFEVETTSSQIVFKVDGSTVATHTTNLPTALIHAYGYIESEASGSKKMLFDFFRIESDRES